MKRLIAMLIVLLCALSVRATGIKYFSSEDTLGHFRTNYNSTVSNLYALIVAGDTNETGTLQLSGISITIADAK